MFSLLLAGATGVWTPSGSNCDAAPLWLLVHLPPQCATSDLPYLKARNVPAVCSGYCRARSTARVVFSLEFWS